MGGVGVHFLFFKFFGDLKADRVALLLNNEIRIKFGNKMFARPQCLFIRTELKQIQWIPVAIRNPLRETPLHEGHKQNPR